MRYCSYSKNETDSIFSVQHAITSCQILMKTASQDLKPKELAKIQVELERLKTQYSENMETIELKDFNVFGGIIEDSTKVKTLHNEKHREVEKDKYKVLNVTPNTQVEVFIDNLRNSLKLVKEALCKITTPFEMPIYMAKTKQEELENLNTANLNATEELYKTVTQMQEGEKLYFHTIRLPKDAPLIYDTNITQYDNFNQTLPMGMDVTTQVLINLEDYKLANKKEKQIYVNYQEDEYIHRVVEVQVVDYEAIPIKKKTK